VAIIEASAKLDTRNNSAGFAQSLKVSNPQAPRGIASLYWRAFAEQASAGSDAQQRALRRQAASKL